MNKKMTAIYFTTEYLSVVVVGAVIMLCAGRMDWWPAWSVAAVMAVNQTIVGIVLLRFQPNLLEERMKPPKSAKSWDRTLVSILRLAQFARYILGGLGLRYGWTHGFPLCLQIVGIAGCLLGYALFTWAMASNSFFSQVVRLQTDRGHAVATSGPYSFVRHPSYAGMFVFEFAMSALLGSWWAVLAGAVCAGLLVLRTALEDRTLQVELPGYKEYAQKVKYRLIPGVW
ncbi:MAG: methyltransferase family protein [Anaerolineaceae bacterium]